MDELLENLKRTAPIRFGAEPSEFRGELTLTLLPARLLEAARILRDEYSFDMLVDVTAVDYWPNEKPRFHEIVQLCSTPRSGLLRLRIPLDGNDPHSPSLEGIFPNANWFEREVWDLFGIHFDGHSDMRRIVMPHDWEGHPLRKDYPLGYEEVQFTFNFDEIDRNKRYAKD